MKEMRTWQQGCGQFHQPRLWFITGGYLGKRWFITAAARARGQSNDLNREILASNLFNCHKEVINAPPVPSISRCIHIVYRHKNVWEYQWSNFIYNCMSTFLHYVHCKDALIDCSAPGGERCESTTWVDVIVWSGITQREKWGHGNKPAGEFWSSITQRKMRTWQQAYWRVFEVALHMQGNEDMVKSLRPSVWSGIPPLGKWGHAGGRLNKKGGLTRYGNSHVKDKTS